MSIQRRAFLLWGFAALISTALLILEHPRDAKHWLLVLVIVGSVALATFSWKATR